MGKNRNKNKQSQLKPQPQPKEQTPGLSSLSFTVLDKQELPNQTTPNEPTIIKSQSKILKHVVSSDSELSVQDFEDNKHKLKLPFTIKQWFHLGLSKIIPPTDKSILIDLISNQVSGEKTKVQKFCQKAQKQIDSMIIKIIKLKIEISPDTIIFDMDDDWKCQIFTSELLRKVWEKILKIYKVTEQMKAQIQSILNKDGITKATRFIWVLKEYQNQAIEVIKRVHKEEKQKSSNSFSGEATVVMSKIQEKPSRQERTSKAQQRPKRQERTGRNQGKNLKTQANPVRSDQKISQSRFIQGIKNSQQSQQEIGSKAPFDDDSDQFDFSSLVTNAHSKNPKKQAEIKNQKEKQKQKQAESFLKLLNDEPQMTRKQRQGASDEERQRQPKTGRRQRGNRGESRRDTTFMAEYPEQYFNKEHLKKWIKGNRHLSRRFRDLEMKQKFSEQEGIMYIEIVFYGNKATKQQEYAFNLYFKHQKVIKLDPQDADLRNKIIQRFSQNENWLRVQYKKIYTKEKYPSFDVLKSFCKSDNSATKMYTSHKNLTHVLYLVGLITQVQDMEPMVQDFIKDLQSTSRKVQIILKFATITQFIRDKKLQNFISTCIRQFMAKQNNQKHKLLDVKPVLSDIIVEIELYGVPDKNLKEVQGNIAEKLQGLIDSHDFGAEETKNILPKFDYLSNRYFLFKNFKNTLTLIAGTKKIKDQMVQINNEIKKTFATTLKEHIIKQKSEYALSKDFLHKKSQNKELPNLKLRFEEANNEYKIVFFGPEIQVDETIAKLQEFLENLQGKIWEYNIELSQQELEIIEKDKELHKSIEEKWKVTMQFNRNYSIAAVINVKPNDPTNTNFSEKTIFFEKEFNFESLQENSIFFFRQRKQLDSIKMSFILPFKALVNNKKNVPDAITEIDKQRKCHFVFKENATASDIIEESLKCNPNVMEIFMYLSEGIHDFEIYFKNLLKMISSNKEISKKQLKLTIVCKKNNDLKKILNLKEGKHAKTVTRRWYTTQNANKLFYSESGNKKIQDALQKGINSIELNNEDLNLTVTTHDFDFDQKVMTHTQSGKEFKIEIHQNKITVNLNGVQKTIPDSEYQKIPKSGSFWSSKKLTNCKLSIGFYRIDLASKTQTNLFSNFQRNLGYEESESNDFEDYHLIVNYEVKTNKLTLEYSDENQKFLKPATDHIKNYLNGKLIEVVRPFDKEFTLELVREFQDEGKQQSIRVFQSQDGKSAVFRAFNEKNIDNFVKMLTHLGKAKVLKAMNVEYPKEWVDQSQDIQIFAVAKNTPEFIQVQNAFTAGTIVELIRIQNKSVYKKYMQERAFLKELNEGKDVKEMRLFHGTRLTDPKVIYEDKEDCFNINYTGEGNLLGRGTYFAERSQYSVNYAHKDRLVPGIESMFYCQVLVGQSQKCLKHDGNIRDTEFKDKVKRIKYESMTDFLQGSNVFVVYKNRRAYPLYLIKYKTKNVYGF